ncbi:MAG TPA: hypothetical protein VKB12_16345 [Pyrinomonadaceae bacterium]|nr:hypothetical protein [Pyrinomonadaceae bacterium]
MFEKTLRASIALLSSVLFLAAPAWAQDTEAAASSSVTEARLPAGAERVRVGSVPAEVNSALKKIVEAGGSKIVQGDSEVLAWSGAGYRRENAADLMRQLQGSLRAKGWAYEEAGREGEVTVFSVAREAPTRRAVLGFYVPTDEALLVAWTEVHAAGEGQINADAAQAPRAAARGPERGAVNAASWLVGTWGTGGMSMMADRNTVTGATTPSNGSTFKYVFTADGRFEFVGLLQSTMYGCTTTLFNDKKGRFETDGSTLTLIPSRNFWRQQNGCAPNSTKEREYTLERETFRLRTKTDEYGKQFVCLTNDKGETCYRRAE